MLEIPLYPCHPGFIRVQHSFGFIDQQQNCNETNRCFKTASQRKTDAKIEKAPYISSDVLRFS